jgi:para-nitrobenzyl esterase
MQRLSFTPCGIAFFLGLFTAACGSGGESSTSTGGAGGTGGAGSTSSTASGTSGDPTLVTTDKGPVKGEILGETRAFLGIPYAAPPTAGLRWKPPQPAAAWSAALDASKVGPACPQFDMSTGKLAAGTSEDCLTLNVWAPKDAPKTAAPVMVWIHGGSFVTGSGGDPAFDGRALSEATGAVVVTINYRLGPLGFLANRELSAEDSAHPASGMYGFEDQRAALAWVKANIALFGGDAKRVALFGESAGAISISLHLISPPSDGLFQRAIIESGPASWATAIPKKDAEAQGAVLTSALGCKDTKTALTCLRGKPTDEVLLALKSAPGVLSPDGVKWFPNIDGLDVPDQPQKLLDAGKFAKVPTLIGTNKNEGTVFVTVLNATTPAEYTAILEALVPGQSAKLAAQYPLAMYSSVKAAVAEVFGDGAFVCSTRRMARAITKGGAAAYVYHFTHALMTPFGPELGVFHGSEIPFVFGNPFFTLTLSADEKPLSNAIMGYWGRMAAAGDPNGAGAFAWPKYDVASEQNIVLDLTPSVQKDLKKSACALWDTLTP